MSCSVFVAFLVQPTVGRAPHMPRLLCTHTTADAAAAFSADRQPVRVGRSVRQLSIVAPFRGRKGRVASETHALRSAHKGVANHCGRQRGAQLVFWRRIITNGLRERQTQLSYVASAEPAVGNDSSAPPPLFLFRTVHNLHRRKTRGIFCLRICDDWIALTAIVLQNDPQTVNFPLFRGRTAGAVGRWVWCDAAGPLTPKLAIENMDLPFVGSPSWNQMKGRDVCFGTENDGFSSVFEDLEPDFGTSAEPLSVRCRFADGAAAESVMSTEDRPLLFENVSIGGGVSVGVSPFRFPRRRCRGTGSGAFVDFTGIASVVSVRYRCGSLRGLSERFFIRRSLTFLFNPPINPHRRQMRQPRI